MTAIDRTSGQAPPEASLPPTKARAGEATP
jgi:hypothetical protein